MVRVQQRLCVAAVVLGLVLVPVAVWADHQGQRDQVNTQVVNTTRDNFSTASKSWRNIDQVTALCMGVDSLTVTNLHLALQGGSAPVEVRVVALAAADADPQPYEVAEPGTVRFAVDYSDTRSFAFASSLREFGDSARLVAQWRSPTGRRATATASTVHMLYEYGTSCV